MQTIVCEGTITQSSEGFATCSTGWLVQLASVPFDYSQLQPETVMTVFTAGFVLYLTGWAVAFGAAQMLNVIRGKS